MLKIFNDEIQRNYAFLLLNTIIIFGGFMHKKEYILMGSVLTYEVVSMLLIAYLYQILDSHLIKIIIQNVANVLSICVTLLAIKVSKKSL